VGHALDVLLDDRAGVELLGHVVRRRADDLHAALERPAAGVGAREGGQERMMDVDDRRAERLQEAAAEDLHVAREDHEVEAIGQQLEHARLGRGLAVRRHRHVLEARAEGLDVGRVIGMVGDDERDLAGQLAAAPSPEKVEQAVLLARDEHRDPGRARGVAQAPVHAEARADLGPEGLGELRAQRRQREGHAHEERAALGIRRVLVGADDVRAARRQEPRTAATIPWRSGQEMSSRASTRAGI
jgi:hypothetical protein